MTLFVGSIKYNPVIVLVGKATYDYSIFVKETEKRVSLIHCYVNSIFQFTVIYLSVMITNQATTNLSHRA